MSTPRSYSCDLTPRNTPRSVSDNDIFNEFPITPRISITPRLHGTPKQSLKVYNSDIITNNKRFSITVKKRDPQDNIPRIKLFRRLLVNHPVVIVP